MKRIQKTSTGLYFDSFKHLKNNLSNLISIELNKLCNSTDLKYYMDLKPVNRKSKLPDMKKIGLIDYKKPSDNNFQLSEEGKVIYNILNKYQSKFNYPSDVNLKNPTINPIKLMSLVKDTKQLEELNYNILKLLLSYSDSADFISPYLLLIKIIESEKIISLDDRLLKIILSQTKLNILNKQIDYLAYDKLDEDLKIEVNRPISYIKNFLQTAMIIDQNNRIIYNKNKIESILLELNDIDLKALFDIHNPKTKLSRSRNRQDKFRMEVLKNFNYKCALTGDPITIKRNQFDDIFILEAAHIIPVSEGGSFSYKNGISLTPELHRIFDLDLFAFEYVHNNKLKVIVTNSNNVKDNGILKSISNKIIDLDKLQKGVPDKIAIQYRKEKLYKNKI